MEFGHPLPCHVSSKTKVYTTEVPISINACHLQEYGNSPFCSLSFASHWLSQHMELWIKFLAGKESCWGSHLLSWVISSFGAAPPFYGRNLVHFEIYASIKTYLHEFVSYDIYYLWCDVMFIAAWTRNPWDKSTLFQNKKMKDIIILCLFSFRKAYI